MIPPLIVGIGGTLRPYSSTEHAIARVLHHAEAGGARTRIFAGPELLMPFFGEEGCEDAAGVAEFIAAMRAASCFVIGSPGYHGGISGLVKNALDYTEMMSRDERPYFHGCKVVCVATGAGWQGANTTLAALRNTVFALRGWPIPLGVALNSREPLFHSDGSPTNPSLDTKLRIAAEQII